VGAGSAVRTADATERFSDRIPTARAQFSAEFVGNPQLDPERSNQIDFWLEGRFGGFALDANIFYRRVDDFITIQATDLPKRLPLSPPVVYQYVNGEAEFQGGELTATSQLSRTWRLRLSSSYLEGDDVERDEPAFGVAPWRNELSARYESEDRDWFGETLFVLVDSQDEVAVSRNEAPTDSYATIDLLGGYRFGDALMLQLGIVNITDEDYVNHLNARNPFTAQPIPEPGRVAHFTIRYAF
jgi:iron complex outermembrane receptor protein